MPATMHFDNKPYFFQPPIHYSKESALAVARRIKKKGELARITSPSRRTSKDKRKVWIVWARSKRYIPPDRSLIDAFFSK